MMTTFLLQAQGGNLLSALMPFVLILLVMYLFFLRPQMKRQKEENAFRKDIAKGQRVVLSSGIHGKILEVQETTIILETENARLKVEKAAISKDLSKIYLKDEKEAK
jgi:preprotein translocase subunit YajC